MAITKHAMTRYAERIAGRDELIDINIYIAQNEDKIIDDIILKEAQNESDSYGA